EADSRIPACLWYLASANYSPAAERDRRQNPFPISRSPELWALAGEAPTFAARRPAESSFAPSGKSATSSPSLSPSDRPREMVFPRWSGALRFRDIELQEPWHHWILSKL